MKVVQHTSEKYPPRTYHNANSADLTVAFAEDFESFGEKLTKKAANGKYVAIPLSMNHVEAARLLWVACRKFNVSTLNVAGNGIYSLKPHGWTQESLNQWVYDVLKLVKTHWPLTKIISGGQTGVDFAGGVAGEALGLEVVMTFPKGFLQRTLTQNSFTQSEENVLNTVASYLKAFSNQ